MNSWKVVANFSQEGFMRELNPIGREDNSLLLISEDGERFSLTVDETLLRTLKEHKVPDSSGEPLSPRQIQDAIRAGESISDIAERSGTSLSLVERFAHPVLEELQHMVDLALSIRVELPADRFNEVEKKPFGEVVAQNLASSGADNVQWIAKRSENSIWEISVGYLLNGSAGTATWTFDPRRYQLTPETSNAQALSKPGSEIDSPLRNSAKTVPAEHPSNSKSDAVVTADKLEAFRSRRAKAEAIIEADLEPETQPAVEDAPDEVIAEVVQITQVVEVIPQDVGEESQLAASETEDDVEIEPRTVTEPEVKIVSEVKKSRAPMPSWDQIVRGTQSDDEEAF
jgi:hypothetical protein